MLGMFLRRPIVAVVVLVVINLAVLMAVIALWPSGKFGSGDEQTSYGASKLPYRHDASKELAEAKKDFKKSEKESGANSAKLVPMLDKMADHCLAEQEFDEAAKYYERALKLRKQTNLSEDDDLAQSLLGLAECYHQQGNDTHALESVQRAQKINERIHGANDISVYTCMSKLAVLYENLNEVGQAENCLRTALAIAEKRHVSEDGILTEALTELANILDRQERFSESEKLYHRVVAINEKELGKNNPGVASALVELASNFVDQEKFVDAEAQYQRALKIADSTSSLESSILQDIATGYIHLLHQRKQENRFEALANSVLEIANRKYTTTGEDYSTILNSLASDFRTEKDYTMARELYKRAVAAKEGLATEDDAEEYVDALVNLGDTYHSEHDYAGAAAIYQKALAQTKKRHFDFTGRSYCGLLKSVADNYYYARDFAKGETFYKQRIEQLGKATEKDDVAVADAWYDLGADYYTWHKYKEAVAAYRKAVEISRSTSGDDSTEFAYNLCALAGAKGKTGDTKGELVDLRNCLDIYLDLEDDSSVMSVASDLTTALRKLNMQPEATALKTEMHKYYEEQVAKPEQKKYIGALSEFYGSFLADTEQYVEAEKMLRQGLELQSKQHGFTNDDVSALRSKLAKTLAALKNYPAAAAQYAEIADKAANVDYFDARDGSKILQNYALVLQKLNRTSEAQSWAARAKAAEPVYKALQMTPQVTESKDQS